jgi:MFS family permease
MNKTINRYYLYKFLVDFSLFSAVLVPFFTKWGGITLLKVQFLQSWFMFWIFILEVPTGVIADYLGRKYSIALGAIMISIGALVYGSVPKFEIFLLGEFLFATAIALQSGADSALLYDSLKEANRKNESKKVFGRAYSIKMLGIFLSAPLGSMVANRFGLNAPMLLSAIPFLLAGIVVWTIKEPKRFEKTSEQKRYLEIAKKGIQYFRGHRVLRLLALNAVLVASAAYFVIWFYQPLLTKIGMPIIYFGWFHALLVAAEILISANFIRLEKWFKSSQRFLKFSAVITGLSFFLVAVYPHLITIILFIVLAGGFGLTRLELMSAHMNRFIPSEQRATILSSISMFKRFALVIFNPIVGLIADRSLGLALFLVSLLPLTVLLLKEVKLDYGED